MYRRYVFITVCLIAACSVAQAQYQGNAQLGHNVYDNILLKITEKTLGIGAEERVEGSPYMNDTFVDGFVTIGKKSNDAKIRYNVHDDNFEFKRDSQRFILDPNPIIKKIDMEGKTFLVKSYDSKGKSKLGFFILLDTGKMNLFLKKVIVFHEAIPEKPLEPGRLAKYTNESDQYYYSTGNGQVARISNLKSFIAEFPDKQAELTQFAKKEKVSFKDPEEMTKLVKYYNSL